MKKLLFACFLVLMMLPFVAHSGTDPLIFGPESYDRTGGSSNVYDETFHSILSSAYLVVFNGDDEQDWRVSSGSVAINGAEVVSQNDLNAKVDRVVKPVSLKNNNTMEITLDGNPGGYITVLIVVDPKRIPEFTAGRIQLAWTSIADAGVNVQLRLKNGSPCFPRNYKVRFFNEDGTFAAASELQQLPAHGSANAALNSFLPSGSNWQTGSVEILFVGKGGGRILGFGTENQNSVPLQFGGLRHYFKKPA